MINSVGLSVTSAITASCKPIAGRIKSCLDSWHKITCSSWVLQVVREGYRLQFKCRRPELPFRVKNLPTTNEGASVLDFEVQQMLLKKAIHVVKSSESEIISCFFARPKKQPGKWRPIVSLKYLNKFLRYMKFRMTTVKDVKSWIRKDHYFTSIDLTDAYFSIPLHPSAWNYIRFMWRGITYEFKVIMFGLEASPRVFTKVLKAVVRFLRITFAIRIVAYLDDFLIQAASAKECALHTEIVILVFQILGFEVNYSKSNLAPSTEIEHLGFIWNSVKMTISLPTLKKARIVDLATRFLGDNGLTANELRSFLGVLESVRPVVEVAPLHYRSLQRMLRPLRKGPWRGQKFLFLTPETRLELEWWAKIFPTPPFQSAPLQRGSPTVEMMADASGIHGWGGHSSRGEFCQGEWSAQELRFHINRKEIKAAHQALRSMMLLGEYVHLSLDNQTAVAFINRMGGTRSIPLCADAIRLWQTVLEKRGWVKAVWVPREENQLSDMLSKTKLNVWEITLSPSVVQLLWDLWFIPEVDVFASRKCHVLPDYYSWYLDQGAKARDAFSLMKWPAKVYCFPPVPLIPMTLSKIARDGVLAILVIPEWRTAIWWDLLTPIMVEGPVKLGFYKEILIPLSGQNLPYLHPLVACLVKGKGISPY